jgi:hypothetical protein
MCLLRDFMAQKGLRCITWKGGIILLLLLIVVLRLILLPLLLLILLEQKELALTPAKNATTLNPFKIIPLQSTRKENIWETEETLARASVILETERAKWPNP